MLLRTLCLRNLHCSRTSIHASLLRLELNSPRVGSRLLCREVRHMALCRRLCLCSVLWVNGERGTYRRYI